MINCRTYGIEIKRVRRRETLLLIIIRHTVRTVRDNTSEAATASHEKLNLIGLRATWIYHVRNNSTLFTYLRRVSLIEQQLTRTALAYLNCYAVSCLKCSQGNIIVVAVAFSRRDEIQARDKKYCKREKETKARNSVSMGRADSLIPLISRCPPWNRFQAYWRNEVPRPSAWEWRDRRNRPRKQDSPQDKNHAWSYRAHNLIASFVSSRNSTLLVSPAALWCCDSGTHPPWRFIRLSRSTIDCTKVTRRIQSLMSLVIFRTIATRITRYTIVTW